jgi:hypothetical protein
LNPIKDPLAKRLILIALYLVITICALNGWASVTNGPGYMQIRAITTIIAAIAFYLLFSGDLKQIFNLLFGRHTERNKQIAPPAQETASLPTHSIPVPSLESRRVNTAEMVPPPSVTEHTTILLDKPRH